MFRGFSSGLQPSELAGYFFKVLFHVLTIKLGKLLGHHVGVALALRADAPSWKKNILLLELNNFNFTGLSDVHLRLSKGLTSCLSSYLM